MDLSTRRAVSGKPGIVGCAGHFEKMLYDNSQLARVYLHAWQVTGNQFFRTIVEEILDYVVREMTGPDGGFFDTSDDHETLITRPRDLQDNATPSGSAMAVTALLKLVGFTNNLRYVDFAHQPLVR